MENNIYILTWKNTINTLIKANKLLLDKIYTTSKESNDIRELASKQLSILDETKPDKSKSLYKQANEQQKEFIDYLEKVILYGNLEGVNNINL